MATLQRESAISFPFLGDWSINPPSYFTLFGRPIYFYGVLIGLAFLIGIRLSTRRGKRFGLREDDLYDVIIWVIPCSILGARLYYVLFSLPYYLEHPGELLAVWKGGLAIYGGVIAGFLVTLLLCRKKKMPLGALLDAFSVPLPLGQAIGRWGNFMNREAFGAETEIFCRMGLTAPDGTTIYVHPTFLYESLWNLGVILFLLRFEKKGRRRFDGQLFVLYLLLYGLGRSWIEGLRTDSLYLGSTGVRVSQALSLALVLFAAALLFVRSRRPFKPEDLYVNRAGEPVSAAEEIKTAEPETAPQEEAKEEETDGGL